MDGEQADSSGRVGSGGRGIKQKRRRTQGQQCDFGFYFIPLSTPPGRTI